MKNLKYYPEYEADLFRIEHVHIKIDQQVPVHQQEPWELAFIITGQGKRSIRDTVEYFVEGEIIFIPPNIPHGWSFDENKVDNEGKIENVCIFFKNDFFEECKTLSPAISKKIQSIQDNKNAISFRGKTLKELQYKMIALSKQSELEQLSSVMLILDIISSSKDSSVIGKPFVKEKREKKMQEIYLFVLGNFHRRIELDEVAKHVGMPKSSFCIFFKKMKGKSFFTYLNEFRIESASEMLLKTRISISEICIASGFSDVPYFNRVFKKLKKTKPSEFRKQNVLKSSST